MRTGIIDAEINDMWAVAHDSGELGAAATTYTISGLAGDTDLEYKLIVRGVGGSSISFNLRFNGDSGSNYGWQNMTGVSTTAAAARGTGATSIPITWGTLSSGELFFADVHIFSKSGKERTTLHLNADRITGTTVTNLAKFAGVWNNTADEMTSISVVASNTNGIAIGSRIILLKKVHNDAMKTGVLTPNKIEGAWERIYSNTLTSAATTVTVSGLTGNTDVLYRAIVMGRGNAASATIKPTFNADSGSNYGWQALSGSNTTASAVRATGAFLYNPEMATTDTFCDILIYAKSGYGRTALWQVAGQISTTTVSYTVVTGSVWSNTADEMTSIEFVSDSASGWGVGSNFELYKLNL